MNQGFWATTISHARVAWRTLPIVLCAIAFSGCGRSPFELAPVTGTVTIDGKPLTSARVMFAPVAKPGTHESGKPAVGRLGADGSFHLTTYDDDDGAVVGDHWVTIIRTGDESAAGTATGAAAGSVLTPTFDRLAVPKKVSVSGGQENHIDIKLTATEVTRYGRRFD
jgi:hypothetical protein